MSLKQKLRSEIQLIKEEKKRSLIEEKIIESRLQTLSRTYNKNSKIQTKRLFNGIFEEIKFVNRTNIGNQYLNENLIDVLGQLFQEDGDQFMDTLKVKLTDFLVDKLSGTDFDREMIEKVIGDTEIDDVSKLFTDTRFLAKKLSDIYSTTLNDTFTLDLSSLSGPTVSSQITSDDFRKKLEDEFVDKLRPIMGDVNSKMELKLRDIRDGIIS